MLLARGILVDPVSFNFVIDSGLFSDTLNIAAAINATI